MPTIFMSNPGSVASVCHSGTVTTTDAAAVATNGAVSFLETECRLLEQKLAVLQEDLSPDVALDRQTVEEQLVLRQEVLRRTHVALEELSDEEQRFTGASIAIQNCLQAAARDAADRVVKQWQPNAPARQSVSVSPAVGLLQKACDRARKLQVALCQAVELNKSMDQNLEQVTAENVLHCFDLLREADGLAEQTPPRRNKMDLSSLLSWAQESDEQDEPEESPNSCYLDEKQIALVRSTRTETEAMLATVNRQLSRARRQRYLAQLAPPLVSLLAASLRLCFTSASSVAPCLSTAAGNSTSSSMCPSEFRRANTTSLKDKRFLSNVAYKAELLNGSFPLNDSLDFVRLEKSISIQDYSSGAHALSDIDRDVVAVLEESKALHQLAANTLASRPREMLRGCALLLGAIAVFCALLQSLDLPALTSASAHKF